MKSTYYYTGSQIEVSTAKASNPLPSVVNPPIRSQLILLLITYYVIVFVFVLLDTCSNNCFLRLKMEDRAHKKYSLTPDPNIKPRLLPKHVLLECSPYYALKYTLDVRSLPKKALLLLLAEHCTDQREGDCLRFLSSKEVKFLLAV